VRSSGTAVRAEAASRLTVTEIDIAAVDGACATGFELTADAALTASEVSTHSLGTAFWIMDQTTASISRSIINGGNIIYCARASFDVSTTGTFALAESIVDGGEYGIQFRASMIPTTATLTDTTIRNMRYAGLKGDTVVLTMTGGEISSSEDYGIDAGRGTWTLNNVTIKQNIRWGVRLQGRASTLVMRGCTIKDNMNGIYLSESAVDLGTDTSPGNNTFLNTSTGLWASVCQQAQWIPAVGNTWVPGVQGSNAAGRYPVVTDVPGPVDVGAPTVNFAITMNCILRR
jgi:hypothetical protein